MVHRDVKPANILAGLGPHRGFGLGAGPAHRLRHRPARRRTRPHRGRDDAGLGVLPGAGADPGFGRRAELADVYALGLSLSRPDRSAFEEPGARAAMARLRTEPRSARPARPWPVLLRAMTARDAAARRRRRRSRRSARHETHRRRRWPRCRAYPVAPGGAVGPLSDASTSVIDRSATSAATRCCAGRSGAWCGRRCGRGGCRYGRRYDRRRRRISGRSGLHRRHHGPAAAAAAGARARGVRVMGPRWPSPDGVRDTTPCLGSSCVQSNKTSGWRSKQKLFKKSPNELQR